MAARYTQLALLIGLLTGCLVQSPTVTHIALLAPFEGRYRAIGYEALYAARLAFVDASSTNAGSDRLQLLAIDDGGTTETAVQRAGAIAKNPSIGAVILLGTHATDTRVLNTLAPLPVIIAGHWGATLADTHIFQLTAPGISDRYNLPAASIVRLAALDDIDQPIIGHEILSLPQFIRLNDTISPETRLLTGGRFADADFTARYAAVDSFAPPARLIAPLTYDATGIAIQSLQTDVPISDLTHIGYHGRITFEDGYWNQPTHTYSYSDGSWQLLNSENTTD